MGPIQRIFFFTFNKLPQARVAQLLAKLACGPIEKGFFGPEVKPRRWAVTTFCMPFEKLTKQF